MTYPSSNQQKAYPPNIDKYFADDNDAGRLLAESDVNNNITRYYIYGTGLLAAVTPEGQTYCYHYNGIGSTIAITDSNQAIVNKYSYDAFGNIANQQEAIAQPFKYVGQAGVMTEPNGFYYMKARYYDPQVGRFISEDPIGFDGGDVNLMAYVGNNPVNGIDPSGLCGLNTEVNLNWTVGFLQMGFTKNGPTNFGVLSDPISLGGSIAFDNPLKRPTRDTSNDAFIGYEIRNVATFYTNVDLTRFILEVNIPTPIGLVVKGQTSLERATQWAGNNILEPIARYSGAAIQSVFNYLRR